MELTFITRVSLHTKKLPLGSVRTIYTERADYYKEGDKWVEYLPEPVEKITFDDQKRVIEFVTYSKGSVERTYINKFDTRGNLTEAITFDSSGSIEFKTDYTYDSKGIRSTHIIYKGNDELFE